MHGPATDLAAAAGNTEGYTLGKALADLDAAGHAGSCKEFVIPIKGDGAQHVSRVHEVSVLHSRLHLQHGQLGAQSSHPISAQPSKDDQISQLDYSFARCLGVAETCTMEPAADHTGVVQAEQPMFTFSKAVMKLAVRKLREAPYRELAVAAEV